VYGEGKHDERFLMEDIKKRWRGSLEENQDRSKEL